ncbi:MAG: rhomboid family intramembrane serine protease [Vicingaceae bacterium]
MLTNLPPVVKNLLIINVLALLATSVLDGFGIDLTELFGLHHWSSDLFRPHQFVTYMFMHGGIAHLFFNMFALWMFGRILEQVWGSQRFLIYYMFTGIGAGFLQMLVVSFQLSGMESAISEVAATTSPDAFANFIDNYVPEQFRGAFNQRLAAWIAYPESMDLKAAALSISNELLELRRNIGTVGASGSVFGILLAFGVLFPNTELFLLFPPIPIKAKYFVFGYGLIELYMGFASNPSDNVAHFAHLGGMLFGYILIRYWKNKTNNFY